MWVAAATPVQHIIVIDAGSSGTRLHLFAYQQDATAPSTLTTIKEIKQIREKYGLATLKNDSSSYNNYFNSLFSTVDRSLTADERTKTPVYLFATAGFRLLNKTKQEQLLGVIMPALSKTLQHHGYSVDKQFAKHVRVIYGRTEALFAWLTVNYLMQNLSADNLNQANNFGVLDLGGASTQMTFLAKEQPQNNFAGFVYQQKLYLLFAKTYPGYGVNQAESHLQKVYGDALAVCYPKTGKANFHACLQLINQQMDKQNQQKVCELRYGQGECNALGVYQPSIQQIHFIAIAYYYPIFQLLGLADEVASLSQLKRGTMQLCATPWTTLIKQYANQTDENTLAQGCLRATWAYALLRHYGLQDKTPLIVTEKIAGASTDWPLGAAIYLLTQTELPISLYET